ALEYLGDLAHTSLQLLALYIPEPARLDVQPQVPASILALLPAVAIAVLVEMVRAQRLQGEADAVLQSLLEPVQAPVVDGVFQAGVLTLDPVAVVALQGHHAFGGGNHLFRRHEADQAA